MNRVDRPAELRVLGLFAGIGGAELGVAAGLRRVGVESRCVGFVERESFCAACLAAAMQRGALAPCPIWMGDIGAFPAADFAGRVDLVVAGFPCQPASTAGKRRGRNDARWLWPRVVDVLRATRAPLVFLENVRGLLSVESGRGFAEVLRDLAGLGFDAEWTLASAQAVGAPHRRDRVFILGARPLADAERGGVAGEWRSGESRGRSSSDAPQHSPDLGDTDCAEPVDLECRDRVGTGGQSEPPRAARPMVDAAGARRGDAKDVGADRGAGCGGDRGERSGARSGEPERGSEFVADAGGVRSQGPFGRSGEAEPDQRRGGNLADSTDLGRQRGTGLRDHRWDGVPPGPDGESRAAVRGESGGSVGDVADAVRRDEHEVGTGDEPRGELEGGRGTEIAAGPRATGAGELADTGRVDDRGLGGSGGGGGETRATQDGSRQRERSRDAVGPCGEDMADSGSGGRGQAADAVRGGQPVTGWPCPWPPGPGDRDTWSRIIAADPGLAPATQSRVRRVADGVPEVVDRSELLDAARRAARADDIEFGPCEECQAEGEDRWIIWDGAHAGTCYGLDGVRFWLLERRAERRSDPRADRLRALGNAVVPEQAAAAFVELWRRAGLTVGP